MNKQDIIREVGADRYASDCIRARKYAPNTGRLSESELASSFLDTNHDVDDIVWFTDNDMSAVDKVNLHFDIYQDMPSYGVLMYISMQYYLFDDAAIDTFWSRVIECLSNEDESIGRPVAFMVWIDFFEHPSYDEFSWRKLGRIDLNEHVIRRVLGISGPLPFEWKESFYRSFIGDKRWHKYIFEGIYGSAFDMFGKIDKTAALDIFDRLELDQHDSKVAELRHFLVPSV